jgi:integrase
VIFLLNYVDPIKNIHDLNLLLLNLKESNIRNYLLFKVQLKLALRISDCLNLKIKNLNLDKSEISLIEKKTKKKKILKIDEILKNELEEYIKTKNLLLSEQYLFFSRKSYNKKLTRQQAHNIIKKASSKLNLENINIATHSIRKTTAYHLYKKTNDIALVMYLLNHSSEQMTLRYLGITQENLNQELINLF